MLKMVEQSSNLRICSLYSQANQCDNYVGIEKFQTYIFKEKLHSYLVVNSVVDLNLKFLYFV